VFAWLLALGAALAALAGGARYAWEFGLAGLGRPQQFWERRRGCAVGRGRAAGRDAARVRRGCGATFQARTRRATWACTAQPLQAPMRWRTTDGASGGVGQPAKRAAAPPAAAAGAPARMDAGKEGWMAEDRDTLTEHYQRMREELLSAIDGLAEEQLTERSLDGWSVKDHLAHLSLWDDVRASEVVRISAGHDSAWRMSDDQDATYSSLGFDLRVALSIDQVVRTRHLAAETAGCDRGCNGARGWIFAIR
jgi:hypothetical protein